MQQRKLAIVFAVLSAMLGAGAEDWKEKPAQDASVAQLRGRALAAEEKARAEAAEESAEVRARADQGETQAQEGPPQNLTKLNVSANEVQAGTADESGEAVPDDASPEAMAKTTYFSNYNGRPGENCYPGHGSSPGDNYKGRVGPVKCASICDQWRRWYGRCDGFVIMPAYGKCWIRQSIYGNCEWSSGRDQFETYHYTR